jgi:hypothetical protein
VPTDDPYRHPARDVERYAVALVSQWLGDRSKLADTSPGHGTDFRIDYDDGGVAIGEVAWHADPVVQEMWANVFRREHHQVIDLRRGVGQWAVTVARGASIKRLYTDLPALIGSLAEVGSLELVISGNWPRGELADIARRLGVERIALVDQQEPAMPSSSSTGQAAWSRLSRT